MAKQQTIVEENNQIEEKLPTEVPTDSILTVSEDEDTGELEVSSTIPISKRTIVEEKARQAKESRKLPPIPGFNPTFEQLETWLKLLDEDMWSHIGVYLYRQWPFIVRQMSDPDNPKYIDIITKDHVDEGLIQYVQNTHGGGKYKVWVIDLDYRTPKGKTNQAIMEPTFKVDANLFEPKLNLKELDMGSKNNVGYITTLTNKGIINAKGEILATATQTQGAPAELAGQMGQMFDRFMSMYAAMDKDKQATINKILGEGTAKKEDGGIQNLLLEKLRQDDPNKQVEMMMKLFEAMKPNHKEGDSLITLLIKQMNDSAERQMQMMNKMFELKAAEPKEDFMDKYVKYRTALPELFGGSAPERPAKRETAEIIIDGIKEIGLPAIGLVSQLLEAKGYKPIIPVTEQQAQAFVNQNPNMPQPPPQQNKVLPMPSQPQQTANPNGQPVALDPNNLTVCQKLLIQYGGMIINAIKSGMDGATLADNLESAAPILGDVYGVLKAQGKAEILKAMESIPEFWSQTGGVYGKDHMIKLVDEFLLDPPDDDEDDDNQDDDDDNDVNNKGAK